jgi:release factor glutamine methyltransferase
MSPSPDGTVSWRELLAEAADRLAAAGVDGAEMDARRIVADCVDVPMGQLGHVLGEPATERGVARFDQLVARRAAGEPLQYVLGSWGFRTLELMVDRRVLIPRPETESVVEVALAELDRLGGRDRPTRVVDLGTGSGAIALSIAVERVRTEVWATDVSADALRVARANVAGIGRPGARVRTEVGDWFDALPSTLRGTIDLVVTNPPYVATTFELPADVAHWEPPGALHSGADGLDDLRRILAAAPDWLTASGVLVSELSPEQADAAVELALERFGEASVESDLTGRPRALVARMAGSAGGASE